MKILELDGILQQIENRVKAHELETGVYARWLWKRDGSGRDTERNAYGCADAANILYTLNRFPQNPEERAAWISALQGFQNEKDGYFHEGSHHVIHTTAHCTGALELFDARPLYPFTDMEYYKEMANFAKMLEDMDWLHKGKGSHCGAGIYAAFVITGAVDRDWVDGYFRLFDETCNRERGLWCETPTDERFTPWFQVGDAFHYLFNYQHARHPFPYPDKLIDFCLDIYANSVWPADFGRQFHFIEMDWAYCLNRASRETPHRFEEVKATLSDFAENFIEYLNGVDWENNPGCNDLHLLFGTVCCLAELQQALPGKLHSSVPLRLVLDRRPFI
jgi:hypothetical protein